MGYRVIVSPQGQQRVLEELHAGHPGMARMKGLARTIVWWPGLDVDIERKVQGCFSCQEKECTTKSSIASLVFASSALDEGARGLRRTLARKNVSCTH